MLIEELEQKPPTLKWIPIAMRTAAAGFIIFAVMFTALTLNSKSSNSNSSNGRSIAQRALTVEKNVH